MVVLEPPLTRSGPWRAGGPPDQPLVTAARYMRSRGMSRWHRPRSGIRHGRDGHLSWLLWCGQSIHGGRGQPVTADEVPVDGGPVCGTCEGRAAGAGQDSWPVPGPRLLFTPRRLTRPARCPGMRSENLHEQAGMVLRCLACGELVPGRLRGRPYDRWYGPADHPPGDGLVPGCPFHAWSALIVHKGTVMCGCQAPDPYGTE